MFNPSLCAISVAAALSSFSVLANNEIEIENDTTIIPFDYIALEKVQVSSEPFAQKMGTQQIDSDMIDTMPTSNGMVSDLLKNNPNVQFSSKGSLSESQGEIAPENVSFHGERFYGNSWLLDGLSNNDNVNPGSNNGSLGNLNAQRPYLLPDGGTQSFWISSDLIDSVDVYDSNVSAKYGQFTGGVIDAKLKRPDTLESTGSISYRITRDEWTQFHFENEESETEFEKAGSTYSQPEFTKQIYAVNVNQPLSDSTALLLSYNRVESDIPFYHTLLTPSVREDQKRLAETYLLKGVHELDSGDVINLTFMYSPHDSKYISANVKDGSYTNYGGGYRVNADWEHYFDQGKVTSYVGYINTQNAIEYEKDNAFTWVSGGSIDWVSSPGVGSNAGTALEGGYGQIETNKQTLVLKQDVEFEPLFWGVTEHHFSLGWKSDFATAHYERKNDTTYYVSTGMLKPAKCYEGDSTCIAGEQAADVALKYYQNEVVVSNDHHAVYVQDNIVWNQFEFTPGVRVDYDEFLDNVDIAPRLTASYDVFNNKKSVIFGGANRYYSDSLLTYALSETMGRAVRYSRDDYDQGWQLVSNQTYGGTYKSSDIRTPYSDELNIGFSQKIYNSEWTIKWVNRQGKDQFVKATQRDENNRDTLWLTNDGSSEADSFTLSARLLEPLKMAKTETFISLGANYIQTRSNFTSYDPEHEIRDDFRFYLDGEIITYDELMAKNNFNTPWYLFTNIETDIEPLNLVWSQSYRYTAGYKSYQATGDSYQCNANDSKCNDFTGSANIYEEVNYKARVTADWRFSYAIPIKNTSLDLNLDILNVFNAKVEGSSGTEGFSNISYKPGRIFWLGGRYQW